MKEIQLAATMFLEEFMADYNPTEVKLICPKCFLILSLEEGCKCYCSYCQTSIVPWDKRIPYKEYLKNQQS